MKKLLTGVAVFGLAAVLTSGIEASASGTIEGSAPSAASTSIIAHGEHYNCTQGPRGWWHVNSQITGLPRFCILGRS